MYVCWNTRLSLVSLHSFCFPRSMDYRKIAHWFRHSRSKKKGPLLVEPESSEVPDTIDEILDSDGPRQEIPILEKDNATTSTLGEGNTKRSLTLISLTADKEQLEEEHVVHRHRKMVSPSTSDNYPYGLVDT